jgi:hypothetical protein
MAGDSNKTKPNSYIVLRIAYVAWRRVLLTEHDCEKTNPISRGENERKRFLHKGL